MNETYPDAVTYIASLFGLPYAVTFGIVVALALWTIVWKGLGLWKAARNQQKYWFILFLIINDLGILEMIYLLWFRKDKKRMMPAAAVASAIEAS